MESTAPLVNVLPTCLTLCDLKNDGYFKLIAAEMSNNFEGKAKLKVFKGITLMSERGLPGCPSAISILYIDEHEPKIPSKSKKKIDGIIFFLFWYLKS